MYPYGGFDAGKLHCLPALLPAGSADAVKVAKQTKLESEYSDVKDVIVDAIAFTKGGSEWTLTTDNIIAVDAIESSDYVVIKSVTVKVPVGVDGGIKDTYYEVTVPVKMTVKYSK